MTDSKIVYRDGAKVRVLRGHVNELLSTGDFLTVERLDGRFMIARSEVLRVEEYASVGPIPAAAGAANGPQRGQVVDRDERNRVADAERTNDDGFLRIVVA